MSQVNVLIAEDFPAFRELIQGELRQRPELRVVAVNDGLAAVEQAAQLQPELTILDLGLPALDGLAVARRLRSVAPDSSIVFFSQEAALDVIQAALNLGSRGFLHKTRARYLLPVVDAILEERRSDGAPHCSHKAQFCSDETTWLEAAEHHLGAALRAGDAAVTVTRPSHTDRLLAHLREGGIDVDRLTADGSFVQLDADALAASLRADGVAAATPTLTQTFESAAAAANRPGKRVAIFGELAPMLWATGDRELALELEQFDAELTTISADIMCAYPMMPIDASGGFKTLCAHHGAIVIR